jgi:iron complex transport system substrate-binding protein
MPVRRLALPALAAALALALAACAGPATGGSADEQAASSGGGFPVTIHHAFGDTVIPSKPKRVAAISSENADAALALGVTPVGLVAQSYGDDDGDGILPWTKAQLTKLGGKAPVVYTAGDSFDYEAIAASTPDVILAAYSGITKEQYQTLSKIAPVVAYPGKPWLTSWSDTILTDGTALGLRSEAEAYIAKQKQAITAAAAAVPGIAGKTAMFSFVDPSKLSSFGYYAEGDARVRFLTDLGFTTPASITKLSASNSSFYDSVSAENVDVFDDVDVIFTYGDDKLLPAMQADPLLGKVPAIQKGAVVVLGMSTPLAASVSPPDALSLPWTLDKLLPLVQAAVAKA